MRAALLLCAALALARAAEDAPRPHSAEELALIEAARNALADGKTADVLARLEDWDGEPSSLRLFLLARAREESGRDADAASLYRRCLALRPGFATARYGLLANLHRRGRHADLLRALPPDFPAGATAAILALAADAAYRAGERALCDRLAGLGLLRHPDDPGFRRLLLLRAMDDGDDYRAAAYLADALDAEPTDVELWLHAAAVRGRLDDLTGRRAALRAAVLLAPEDPAVRLQLMQALSTGGQHRAALRYARRLLDEVDVTVETRGFCVGIALLAGEAETALAWLEAIPDPERTPDLEARRARILIRIGEREQAHSLFASLIEAGSYDADLLLAAADNALALERDGSAGIWYAQARSILAADARRRAHASVGLARIALRAGDRTEAVRILRAALHHRPDDHTLRLMLRFANPSESTQ